MSMTTRSEVVLSTRICLELPVPLDTTSLYYNNKNNHSNVQFPAYTVQTHYAGHSLSKKEDQPVGEATSNDPSSSACQRPRRVGSRDPRKILRSRRKDLVLPCMCPLPVDQFLLNLNSES